MKTDKLQLRKSGEWLFCLPLFFIVPYYSAKLCQSIAGNYRYLIWLYFAWFLLIIFLEQKIIDRIAARTGIARVGAIEYMMLNHMIREQCDKVKIGKYPKLKILDKYNQAASLCGIGLFKQPYMLISKDILKEADSSTIEAVISHEIAHLINKDILITITLKSSYGILCLLVCIIAFKLFGLFTAIALSAGVSSLLYMAQVYFLKKMEFRADHNGAVITGNPEKIIDFFEKHCNERDDFNDLPILHKILYFFKSHPLPRERIEKLSAMGA